MKKASPRRIAYEALFDITERGAYTNLRLKDACFSLDAKDAGFVCAIVKGCLDRIFYIDFIINAFAKGKLDKKIRALLRIGVCQLLFMGVPDSAACNETVTLTREIGKAALSGFVNATLRSIARSRDALPSPTSPREQKEIDCNAPYWLIELCESDFGEEKAKKILAPTAPMPLTVRAQYPFSHDELKNALEARNIGFSPGLFTECFRIDAGQLDINTEPLFTSGKIAVQSEGAMLAAQCLFAKPGMNILDACCAPGGKSAYIASLTQNKAKLTGIEPHAHRREITLLTLSRLHVTDFELLDMDASVFAPELCERFDAVLVDAPCSSLGSDMDARLHRKPQDIAELCALQYAILKNASRYVKKGGRLVYSTCTLPAAENEGVAEKFINSSPEFCRLDLSSVLPKKALPKLCGGMLRLFPGIDGSEGFFAAAFTKCADK